MNSSILPNSYAAWRHCIEVDCGIRLEAAYIRERLSALQDPGDFHTEQFVRRWGEAHRQRVIAWFRQASAELAGPAR